MNNKIINEKKYIVFATIFLVLAVAIYLYTYYYSAAFVNNCDQNLNVEYFFCRWHNPHEFELNIVAALSLGVAVINFVLWVVFKIVNFLKN